MSFKIIKKMINEKVELTIQIAIVNIMKFTSMEL